MPHRAISVQFDNVLEAAQSFLVMKDVTPVEAKIERGERLRGATGNTSTVRP
jgi:hypothetical protein